MSTPLTINSVETLEQALPIIRKAQELYSTFSQEQVDAICENTPVQDNNGTVKADDQPVITSVTVID